MLFNKWFADSISFFLLLFILLTLVTVAIGILRFFDLYTHAANRNHPPELRSENIIPPQDSQDRHAEQRENSLALDYVKRNFFGETAVSLDNKQ
ncbi:hypothetical protein G5B47_17655 [Paenibacillus sp. 7124]|uniref:Uncharacterized protein n=1 Tax=Paenibacillus apii TaxID=1850370 RepID=A0A6M1PLV5_9BACL|nr:hypothetical protein [Paenibacillus apii]NGM84240.1 hypothetical protein [Paenibacillus apii]NJJ40864.1 hypothetical protein [Paenibacillus apii]